MKNYGLFKKLLLLTAVISIQAVFLCQSVLAFDGFSIYGIIDEDILLRNYIATELEMMANPESEFRIVMNADGSVTGIDSSGYQVTAGGKWPKNNITRNLPPPREVDYLVYNEEHDSFTAVWSTTSKGYKEYVEMLENCGFGVYSQEIEIYLDDEELHSYSVIGFNGMTVELLFLEGAVTMNAQYPSLAYRY
ncbi:MAG: hypothetical protein FWE29_01290 [Defluviitaleaceae bacterium]|nr:hypothetical protein [Defluviitaleaceae bacterium]